jgi:hypothetical protein
MKSVKLHPGLILLTFSSFFFIISLINFQKNIALQGFKPSYTYSNNTLYYLGKPMFQADINTFEVLQGGYAQDQNVIYYDGRTVLGLDRNSFEVLGYGIGKDKTGIWVFNRSMNINGETLKALGNLYYQVDDDIYYFELKVEGADISTFQPLPKDYLAQDKNNYYYRGRVVDVELVND